MTRNLTRALLWTGLFASALFLFATFALAAADLLGRPWYFVGGIVYGAILLLLLVALLINRSKPSGTGATPSAAGRLPLYPLEMYRMSAIPEISPAELERLRAHGVNVTDTLLYADLGALAAATQLPPARLARWHGIAQLMHVNGIGPKWATRLVDAGVPGLRQLAQMSPHQLEQALIAAYKATGAPPEKVQFQSRTIPTVTPRLIGSARQAAAVL